MNTHVLLTSKGAGATVWLIGREEDVRGVFWYGWLKAKVWKAPHFDTRGFDGELWGEEGESHMMPLDGGEPVSLEGQPWLKAALNLLGNGAFGLQVLRDPEIIEGLEALRRGTPRFKAGQPWARRKKE